MDDNDEVVETNPVDESLKVQLGRNLFSGAVAWGSSKLADRVYDSVLRAYRSRKSS